MFFRYATQKAYSACSYVLSESAEANLVRLLMSKSKIALFAKLQTIARLKLCGAVLVSNLYNKGDSFHLKAR